MIQKDDIRAATLARRDEVSLQLRADKSAVICREVEGVLARAFTEVDGAHRPLIALYAAMGSEVDLRPLFPSAHAHSWDICFPCMIGTSHDGRATSVPLMAFFRVPHDKIDTDEGEFLKHPLRCHTSGDLKRRGFTPVEPSDIDAIVVPLVAFDDEGNRLGYGQGNYDRYLGLLRPDTIVVGVGFDEQRIDAVPCEPHDRPLPHIVTA